MSEKFNEAPQRRIILPEKKKQAEPSELSLMPGAEHLLEDALSIIQTEILQYKFKTQKSNVRLNPSEARIVQGYIKALTDILKEKREREEEEDFSSLSDEELLNLVENLQKARARKAALSSGGDPAK